MRRLPLSAILSLWSGVFLVPLAAPLFAAPVAFGPPEPTRSGLGSYYVALSDVDGDADLDVIVANYDGREVVVSKNVGGRFGSYLAGYPSGGAVYARAADLDADGRPDLLNIDFVEHTIGIRYNLGDGSFGERRTVPVGRFPRWIAVADVDLDGLVDLLVANHETANVSILSGAAGHTAVTSTVPCGGHPKTLSTGDLDGDGRVDVVIGNYDENRLSILHNLPGGFTRVDLPFTASGISEIVVADFDRDGRLDLAGACEDGTMGVWRNQGSLSFAGSSYAIGGLAQSLATADFDRDGDLDLAAISYSRDATTVWMNDGTGQFRDPREVPSNFEPRGVAAGDVDGDGFPDLVSANYDPSSPGVFSVMRNRGAAVPVGECPRQSFSTGFGPSQVVAADLDGDGRLDLAVANEDQTASVLLQGGSDGFMPAASYPVGSLSQSLAVGDFDRDGRPDLAVANYSESTVSLLLNDGSGRFVPSVEIPVGSHPRFVVAVDVDRDGAMDLVTADYGDAVRPGTVTVLTNDSKRPKRERDRGRPGPPSQAPKFRPSTYPVGVGPYLVGAADLDRDGRVDLYTSDYDGHTVTVLRQKPNKRFEPFGSYPVGWAVTATAGDLDRDGYLDLVVAGFQEGLISILLNRGDGRFGPRADQRVGQNPRSIEVADLNRDGRSDIVVALAGESRVALLTQRADGTFSTSVCESGSVPKWVTVADVDGDGSLDFVTANYGEETVSIIGEPRIIARQAHPLVGAGHPSSVQLAPCVPNPGSAPVTLSFALPSSMRARLDVFDVSGRRIATLVDGVLEAGSHRATWGGITQAGVRAQAGIYFYRLEAGGQKIQRRMSLVH